MSYPHVALTIKDHIPAIMYHPDEEKSRQLTMKQENIADLIEHIAQELDVVDEILEGIQEQEIRLHNLLEIARQSDESVFDAYPQISDENVEFDLEKVMDTMIEEAKESRQAFDEIDGVEGELLDELNANQNADLFAALLDALYNIMVAKTLLAAEEIGVQKIKLVDESKNIRLQEKMASELEKLGLELLVD